VVVPLVVDAEHRPDFRGIDAAAADVARGLSPGTLVSFETTLPVGTTRRRFMPALEQISGLRAGVDLFICHSPERVSSGRVFADLRNYPKLVGGVDEESSKRALGFYESFLTFDERPDLARPNGVWDLGSAEAAEMTKLAETTYRDVNIALANEFARYSERSKLNVHDVIEAANSQPYSHIHEPGVAVGGHCIPVYPRFYLTGDSQATLPAAARAANEEMPRHCVERLAGAMGGLGGKTVVVLGLAYRGGVKESAFSGALPLVQILEESGASARVQDPLYDDAELEAHGFMPYHWGEPCDGAILQANHPEYLDLAPEQLPGVVAVLDGRRWLPQHRWTRVRHLVIGVPE
jgi:nucleotide sugar dehydrogenase